MAGSFRQAKSQSAFAAQVSPIRPRVQVPDVQTPVPVQVNVTVLQVPAAAAVQVPVGLVQVRMLPVWAAVIGPAVSVVPLQVVPRNETPLSGTTDARCTVSPEPPKNRPPFVSVMLPVPTWYWLPGTLPDPVTVSNRSFVGPGVGKPQHPAIVVVVVLVVVVVVATVVVVVATVVVVVATVVVVGGTVLVVVATVVVVVGTVVVVVATGGVVVGTDVVVVATVVVVVGAVVVVVTGTVLVVVDPHGRFAGRG